MIQGEPIKLTLKVLAGGDYGFPNTTDLEFFRAFEDILTERLHQQGELKNPIGVNGREMLAAVHRALDFFSSEAAARGGYRCLLTRWLEKR